MLYSATSFSVGIHSDALVWTAPAAEKPAEKQAAKTSDSKVGCGYLHNFSAASASSSVVFLAVSASLV